METSAFHLSPCYILNLHVLLFFMKGLMFVIWYRKVLVASCMHHKHGIACKYSIEQYSIDK